LIFTCFCFNRDNGKFARGMTDIPKPKTLRRGIGFKLSASAELLKSLNDNFSACNADICCYRLLLSAEYTLDQEHNRRQNHYRAKLGASFSFFADQMICPAGDVPARTC